MISNVPTQFFPSEKEIFYRKKLEQGYFFLDFNKTAKNICYTNTSILTCRIKEG